MTWGLINERYPIETGFSSSSSDGRVFWKLQFNKAYKDVREIQVAYLCNRILLMVLFLCVGKDKRHNNTIVFTLISVKFERYLLSWINQESGITHIIDFVEKGGFYYPDNI